MDEINTRKSQIIEKLVEATDKEFDSRTLTDEMTLRDDLGLDSLRAVTLALDLEDQFGITIPDHELANLRTVGDIFRLVESRVTLQPQKDSE